MHSNLSYAQRCGKPATTPASGTVFWPFTGGRENLGPELRCQYGSRLSRMARVQSIDSGSKKTLAPPADGWRCRTHLLLDRAEPRSLGQHQDESGAEDISGWQRAGLGSTIEFEVLGLAEHHGIDGHACFEGRTSGRVCSA